MSYSVVFSPEAEDQIVELYRFVAKAASPEMAAEYTEAIVEHCEKLKDFPQRGIRRDDIRPGLRIIHYKKRTLIAFALLHGQVVILGIFYGGQNYEARLAGDVADDG